MTVAKPKDKKSVYEGAVYRRRKAANVIERGESSNANASGPNVRISAGNTTEQNLNIGQSTNIVEEVRSKYRNDPIFASFVRAMAEGDARKRKMNDIAQKDVGVVIRENIQPGTMDIPNSPMVVTKKTHVDKKKETLVNYVPDMIKPEKDYASLFTRTTPTALVKAISEMNDLQQHSVCKLGFEHILELDVKDLPGRLSYWVLDTFNIRRCDVLLPTGQSIPVTEDNVHRVLGFPKGPRKIDLIKKKQTTVLYEEWKQQFPDTNPLLIKIHQVKNAMIARVDGSRWFKIHFMVMVVHYLVQSTRNGCVQPRFIKCLEDLSAVDQWNWCELVIRSLTDNKKKWVKNKAQFYTGPTLFLTLFIVDRVRWANSDIKRDFPLLRNWDTKKLCIREGTVYCIHYS